MIFLDDDTTDIQFPFTLEKYKVTLSLEGDINNNDGNNKGLILQRWKQFSRGKNVSDHVGINRFSKKIER